jgi:hypothetical protein
MLLLPLFETSTPKLTNKSDLIEPYISKRVL